MRDNLLKYFILVFVILILEIPLLAEDPIDANFRLSDGVLSKYDYCRETVMYDNVAAIYSKAGSLYYIRNNGKGWIAGFLRDNSHRGIEFNITGDFKAISKLYGEDNIFYFLSQQTSEPPKNNRYNFGKIFVRYNPDQDSLSTVDGVVDFHVIDGKPLILKNDSLNYNGVNIPLMLRGWMEISDIFDSRIVLVKGLTDIEVVDLTAGKSIYQFNRESIADYNDKYNLILEFEDSKTKATNQDQSIYYEIIINGIEDSRTEIGRGDSSKLFHKKLLPGKYHIVKAERWELDKAKGRYVRMNNIYQPDEVKVFIPDNRIIKLKIEFDGKSYGINQSVVYK